MARPLALTVVVGGLLCASCGGGGGTPLPEALPRTEGFWVARHAAIEDEAAARDHEIITVGDSIASMFGGVPVPDSAALGESALRAIVGERATLNAGIRGDEVENVLWRVRDGALDGQSPRLILVCVGANNLGWQAPSELARRIGVLERELRDRCAGASVVVLGVLPQGSATSFLRARQRMANEALSRQGIAEFQDVSAALLLANGELDTSLMRDGLHPNAEGYRRIFEALRPRLLRAFE